jgi:L-iditol 2-dehydrogenase
MRVLMYYSNSDVRVEELPRPRPGPGEMLIKVMASGICGSDVMEWYRRDKVPLVLGHEVAGEVVELGPGTDKFRVGDRVAVTHHVPCNTCHYCLKGNHTMCRTLLKGTSFDPGGFAEFVRVPVINVDRGSFLVPPGVGYEAASFMEPLACVVRGQRRAGISPGRTVLVLGAGISGLLHIPLARTLGAGMVAAGDTIPSRLKKAVEMGAHLALPADPTLPERLKEANQGYLADLVIICFEGFIPLALETVERGGTILFFAGAGEGAKLTRPINDIFWRTEATLTSTYAGAPEDCQTALNLIRSGSIPVESLITHRLGMEEGQFGFQAVARPMDHDSIKVIVEPHSG